MNKLLRDIFKQAFPSISVRRANKQLKDSIYSKESQSNNAYMDNIDVIPIENFRQKYNETFEVKNKFEDKAKTNVMGITIAITIIMGASGLTSSLISKYPCDAFRWASFIILLVAIIYLLISGINAIKVLFDENDMSIIDLVDLSADNNETKEKIADITNRNINRNIVRNNTLYSSYICIRNALICMMALFILISIPVAEKRIISNTTSVIPSEPAISYTSTITIPGGIDLTSINNCIIQDKTTRDVICDGKVYSFVNLSEKYFVQYKCLDNEIIVEILSSFDKVTNESE